MVEDPTVTAARLIYGNGRIVATDGSGYTYDALGGIRAQSAGSDNYWTFAGEQTDEESGFQYLRARYYDPEVGRFLLG